LALALSSLMAIRIYIRIRLWTFSKTRADLQAGEKDLPSAMDARPDSGGCFMAVEITFWPVRPFERPFRHFYLLLSDERRLLWRKPQAYPTNPLPLTASLGRGHGAPEGLHERDGQLIDSLPAQGTSGSTLQDAGKEKRARAASDFNAATQRQD
jgi:hypothetical protein